MEHRLKVHQDEGSDKRIAGVEGPLIRIPSIQADDASGGEAGL